MTEKQTKIVHLTYGIVLSLVIFAVGVGFVVSCVDIYNSASSGAFTPESIKSHFLDILIPVVLCVVSIIGGGVLHAVFPEKEAKARAKVTDKTVLKNLYKKIDLKSSPDVLVRVIKSQRSFRYVFFAIMIANIVINFGAGLVYVFVTLIPIIKDGGVIDTSLDFMVPFLFKALAYTIIPFLVFIVYDVFAKFTYEKELEAVRAIVAHNAKNGSPVSDYISLDKKSCFFKKHKRGLMLALKIVVLVLAISLIIVGFILGDYERILTIANNICTGCIGLG